MSYIKKYWVCFPTTKEQAKHMKDMQEKNMNTIGAAEERFNKKLLKLQDRWIVFNRQRIWWTRIFDFWCDYLWIAIEIDWLTHNKSYDDRHDKYNYEVSWIIVYRIKNYDEKQADTVINNILNSDIRAIRRRNMWLILNKKREDQINKIL